ncbi:MAG: NAD(P)-binding protein, partial [Chloroflexi bacterium]|nr:NAD(P)-binding protein [Chloroflexota bacterium]
MEASDCGHIVILGAGPTGLGAAYRLAELGYPHWDIYEKSDHVGGLASSYHDPHGFIWDHGGHVMFSHYRYFDDLVERMLRGDYDQHMREAWIWIQGRFVPYPFQNNIHRLPPDSFLDCILGIVEAQRRSLPRANFEQWIRAIFGDGIARHFMLPYNFKVWAHPLESMDTQWQGDRVPSVDLRRILQNLLDDRDDVSWGPN